MSLFYDELNQAIIRTDQARNNAEASTTPSPHELFNRLVEMLEQIIADKTAKHRQFVELLKEKGQEEFNGIPPTFRTYRSMFGPNEVGMADLKGQTELHGVRYLIKNTVFYIKNPQTTFQEMVGERHNLSTFDKLTDVVVFESVGVDFMVFYEVMERDHKLASFFGYKEC